MTRKKAKTNHESKDKRSRHTIGKTATLVERRKPVGPPSICEELLPCPCNTLLEHLIRQNRREPSPRVQICRGAQVNRHEDRSLPWYSAHTTSWSIAAPDFKNFRTSCTARLHGSVAGGVVLLGGWTLSFPRTPTSPPERSKPKTLTGPRKQSRQARRLGISDS